MTLANDLVTGEAVPLELRLARLPSRAIGFAIDAAVQLSLLFGALLIVGALSGQVDDALLTALTLVLIVMVFVGYPVIVETLTRGRSLGKLATGLRVVRDDGGPASFRHALIRGLAGFFVDFWLTFGVGAVISSLASSKGKRLGDFFAGTVVVRERVPAQGAPMAWMPPPLAGWATGLDLSRLPDDLALAARQFLSRAPQLASDVRQSMAVRIATDVGRYVSPPAPPGTPPEPYLAAVLAERRNRDLARYAQVGPPRPQSAGPSTSPRPAQAHPPAQAPAADAPAHEVPPATRGFAPPS